MNTVLVLALSLFFVSSCAKPNYQDPPEKITVNQNPDKPELKDCQLKFKASHLCISYKWIKPPTSNTFGEFEFVFYFAEDPNTEVNPFLTPNVKLWMPSMGHGSRPVSIERLGEGKFLATKVFFIMPGDWEIKFQLKNKESVIDEVSDSLEI